MFYNLKCLALWRLVVNVFILKNMVNYCFISEDNFDVCAKPICWETFLGQQFYKLTMVDFAVQSFLIFFVDLPRILIFGRCRGSNFCCSLMGTIEFGITKNVLDIVYSQAICWLAVFYAPLILAVTIVKSILLYFFRLFYVLYVIKNRIYLLI